MSTTLTPSALDTSLIPIELRHRRRETALDEMVEAAGRSGGLGATDAVRRMLDCREQAGSTACGRGVAVPALRSFAVIDSRIVVARSRRGVAWGAGLPEPVNLIALLLSPSHISATVHVERLVRIATWLRLARNRQQLLDARELELALQPLREAWA